MILERLFRGREPDAPQGPAAKSISQEEQQIFNASAPGISALFGYGGSAAGVAVTEQTSLRLSAVYACVQLLSRVMAMTPLILYRDRGIGDKGACKDRAPDHPLYRTLKSVAFGWMPAYQLKECMMISNLLSGNSYAYIHRDRQGRCVGLQYMPHKYVTVKVDGKKSEKEYAYRVNNREYVFGEDEVLHVPGMGYDGIRGLSPIEMAMDAIGKGLAVQEFGSKFFANGINPGGVFEHPGVLGEDAHNRLKADLDSRRGPGNSGKTLILEEGMTYHTTAISPEQAQFIETMKFTVTDIARIFGVPPHMIADLERATFSNIEQQDIAFVKYSMLAWFIRFEQFVNMKCLTEEERAGGLFSEFLVDNLLRGDSQARSNSYRNMRQNGVINADEWRELENMNEIPDGLGKAYLVNGNMISVQAAMENRPRSAGNSPDNSPDGNSGDGSDGGKGNTG